MRNTMEINFNFKIKAQSNTDELKLNTLVGVSGLVNMVGELIADKFIERAFKSNDDKIVCRHRKLQGLKITFYVQ